ncbi:hypothetical protein B0H11DRAFT_1201446 [Mycena galericulata]|nr:hypothetical protein B0H11DRAFT_1201446 [Mycena galericulata]
MSATTAMVKLQEELFILNSAYEQVLQESEANCARADAQAEEIMDLKRRIDALKRDLLAEQNRRDYAEFKGLDESDSRADKMRVVLQGCRDSEVVYLDFEPRLAFMVRDAITNDKHTEKANGVSKGELAERVLQRSARANVQLEPMAPFERTAEDKGGFQGYDENVR